jgi:hypothetical protein
MEPVSSDPIELVKAEIAALNAKVKQLAIEGRYLEADKEDKALLKAKTRLNDLRKIRLVEDQRKELEALNIAAELMMKEFNSMWEEELKQFGSSCKKQKESMEVLPDFSAVALVVIVLYSLRSVIVGSKRSSIKP